jgi:hypothetical protein
MIGPPPTTNDVKALRDWCDQLYQWLTYPDKFEAQFIELAELTANPAAPGTNRVRVYAKDSGGGKTVLHARFATGAVQTVATEP